MDNFMKDRYGVDELTYLMGLCALILALVGTVFDLAPLTWVSIVAISLALVRAFSKNFEARTRENEMLLTLAGKVPGAAELLARMNMGSTHASAKPGTAVRTPSSAGAPKTKEARRAEREARRARLESQKNLAKKMWKQRKTHAFLKCPTCGQTLSVPKGKGKLIVTCPKCHTRMETKS